MQLRRVLHSGLCHRNHGGRCLRRHQRVLRAALLKTTQLPEPQTNATRSSQYGNNPKDDFARFHFSFLSRDLRLFLRAPLAFGMCAASIGSGTNACIN